MRPFAPVLALALAATAAHAQQRPLDLEPLPEPPPPAAGFDQANESSGVTIAPPEGRIETTRDERGMVTVTVTTPEGLEYVLQEDQGDDRFARQTTGDSGVRTPQWVILRF